MTKLLIAVARTARGLVFLVTAVALAAAGTFAALQTRAAKNWLAQAAGEAISDQTTHVAVGRIDGRLPFELAIAGITVADAGGPWLEIDGLAVAAQPLALLRGVVHLEHVAADEVRVLRMPAPAPPQTRAAPLAPFRAPVAVVIDRLDLPRITVAAPVAGLAAVLGARGRLGLDAAAGTVGAALVVERRDGVAGRLSLEGDYRLDTGAFTVAATAAEPPGGVLGGLLGLPAEADLHVEVDGDGTLDDWHGRIEARVGALAEAAADLSLAAEAGGARRFLVDAAGDVAGLAAVYAPDLAGVIADDGVALSARGLWRPDGAVDIERLAADSGATALSLSGTVEAETAHARLSFEAALAPLAGALLPGVADLLRRPVTGEIEAALEADGAIALGRATVTADAMTIAASGRIAPAFDAVAIDVAFDVDDLEKLQSLADAPLAGSLSVAARLDGALESLAVSGARVGLRGVATTGLAFDALDAVVDAAPAPAWSDAALAVAFDAEGTIDGLRIEGAEDEIARLLGARARWQVAGTAPAAGGRVAFDRLAVAGEGVAVDGDGALVDGRRLELSLAVRLPALARLAQMVGFDLAGSLESTVRGTVDLDVGAVAAEVAGTLSDFSADLPGVTETVGGRAPVSARIAVDAAGAVRVDELRLDGRGARLAGNVALAADTEMLSGSLRLDVVDPARYRALIGADIDGRLAAAANLGGSADNPALGVSFTALDVVLADGPPLAAQGWLTAADLAARPAGRLAVSLRAADGPEVTVAADYVVDGARLLLSGIEARGAGVAAAGDLDVPLNGGAVTGALSGEADDVAPLAALAGLGVGGALSFELTLSDGGGRQALSGAAQARAVTVADAELSLARLDVGLDGSFESARLTLAGAGTAAGRPLEVEAAARLSSTPERLSLVADSLSATVAGRAFALEQPATLAIAHGDGTIVLAAPAVAVAGGRIEAALTRGPRGVDLRLAARQVPLSSFATGVGGSLDGEVTVTGAAPAPTGAARLSVAGLHFEDEFGQDLAPVEVAAEAQWAGGIVDAQATVAVPDGARMAAELRLPLTLSEVDYTPVLAGGGRLEGTITGAADLARLSPLVLGDLDRAAGRLDLALSLAGTVEAPDVSGRLTLADGYYENGSTGTVVTELAVELAGDGRQITISRLEGRDGGAGTITGGGGVALDPGAGFPHQMTFDFDGFTAVRREEGEVPVDGRLTLAGSVDGLTLAGELTVPGAELRIPDALPPQVVRLDVVELGGGGGGAGDGEATAEAATAARAPAVELDVVVVLPGRVFVRGRGLTSEWRGRLAITGPAADPLITGSLELVRGTFDLIGKTLDLQQGNVRFDPEPANDPAIAAVATAALDDAVARIEVGGRASAPEVRLSSDPPLPEDEILARLLFGQQVGALTPLQAVQLADGLATLSGARGGEGILGTVRTALGADILEVRQAADDPAGGTVRASKYLTDDVMLSVEQGTAAGSAKATLEVDVTDNISLETDVGADAQGGIGVNIKTDY